MLTIDPPDRTPADFAAGQARRLRELSALLDRASHDPPPPGNPMRLGGREPARPRTGKAPVGRAVAYMPKRDWPGGGWKVFESISTAARAVFSSPGNIYTAARLHKARAGYYWRFADEPVGGWEPEADKRTGRPSGGGRVVRE